MVMEQFWNPNITHETTCIHFFFFIDLYLLFQYLIKVNEIKTKKGVEFLQKLVEYYYAYCK